MLAYPRSSREASRHEGAPARPHSRHTHRAIFEQGSELLYSKKRGQTSIWAATPPQHTPNRGVWPYHAFFRDRHKEQQIESGVMDALREIIIVLEAYDLYIENLER